MYREPLLTREDAESLIGKLVRLEYNRANNLDYVGIMSRVEGAGTRAYLYLDRGADGERELLFLKGMWVVFATTYDDLRPAGEESTFHPVEWNNRHTLTGEPQPVRTQRYPAFPMTWEPMRRGLSDEMRAVYIASFREGSSWTA